MEKKEEIITETEEESAQFFNNPDFIHFVGSIGPPRPGVSLFMVKLEHTYFPSGTDANKYFFLRMQKWEGIIWVIVSIPKEKKNLAEKIAAETGLRIADGIPHMFHSGQVTGFPISNERVFTLVNIDEHLVYKNDPKEIKKLLMQEHQQIEEIANQADKRQKYIS